MNRKPILFYKTNRFESICFKWIGESIRIANRNALIYTFVFFLRDCIKYKVIDQTMSYHNFSSSILYSRIMPLNWSIFVAVTRSKSRTIHFYLNIYIFICNSPIQVVTQAFTIANKKLKYNNLTNTSCAGSRAICPRPCTPHAAAQLQPIHALRLWRPARFAP